MEGIDDAVYRLFHFIFFLNPFISRDTCLYIQGIRDEVAECVMV